MLDQPLPVEPLPCEDAARLESDDAMPRAGGSVLVSIAFWCMLVVATALYASVSLAPKLADWIHIRQTLLANAARLTELEDRADDAERVVAALRSDASRAAQLQADNRLGGNSVGDSSGSRPVGLDVNQSGLLLKPQAIQLVERLAGEKSDRRWILITAALLTVVAFTLLNDQGLRLPPLFRRWFMDRAVRES